MDPGPYRINSPRVISESVDGEAVVVDLETGCYYGLNRSASRVWQMLGQGLPTREIVAVLAKAGATPAAEIETHVAQLVGRFLDEGLIEPAGDAPVSHSPASDAPGSDGSAAEVDCRTDSAGDFEQPVLTKYSDMKELLLLDPIHEVADSGWPAKKPTPLDRPAVPDPGKPTRG